MPAGEVGGASGVARADGDHGAGGEVADRLGQLVGDATGGDDPPLERRGVLRVGHGVGHVPSMPVGLTGQGP